MRRSSVRCSYPRAWSCSARATGTYRSGSSGCPRFRSKATPLPSRSRLPPHWTLPRASPANNANALISNGPSCEGPFSLASASVSKIVPQVFSEERIDPAPAVFRRCRVESHLCRTPGVELGYEALVVAQKAMASLGIGHDVALDAEFSEVSFELPAVFAEHPVPRTVTPDHRTDALKVG